MAQEWDHMIEIDSDILKGTIVFKTEKLPKQLTVEDFVGGMIQHINRNDFKVEQFEYKGTFTPQGFQKI